jgi:anaerobic magnesium-protoporphyrin IX monomethyl ester cyclase
MKVCLIRPSKLMVVGSIPIDCHPPLGLALLAAVVRRAGHEVSAIDAFGLASERQTPVRVPFTSSKGYNPELCVLGLSLEDIIKLVPADVEVIGISSMFSLNWPLDRLLMHQLSEAFPNAVLIAGGESITGSAELCLRQVSALTACVLGEGEETLLELLDAIASGQSLEQVPGLACRDANGKPIRTKPRSRITDLGAVPFPAWDLLPVESYKRHPVIKDEIPRKTLAILATRGCPYRCTFCTSPDMWGTRYYMRDPAHVLKEIVWLYNEFGVSNFEFYDLTAIIKKDWIIEFAKLKIATGLDITWKIPAGTRSEAIDAEVARYLKESGCFFITYAPESGSERMLRLIKKKVSLDNMLVSMRHSHEEGMITYINLILGLPDETHRDVWQTLRFLTKCARAGVADMGLAMFRPYPGSVLFDRLLAEGYVDPITDDYLIESLLIIDNGHSGTVFNTNISPLAYRIYRILAYLALYGTGYVLKPSKLMRAIRNVAGDDSNSIFESMVVFKLRSMRRRLMGTPQPAPANPL